MRRNRLPRAQRGLSLVEAMVAMAVMGFGTLAVLGVQASLRLNGDIAKNVDKTQARTFKAGGFYVNPPGATHYVFSDEGAVVQITGMGPWKVDFQSAEVTGP